MSDLHEITDHDDVEGFAVGLAAFDGPPAFMVDLAAELAKDQKIVHWLRQKGRATAEAVWKKLTPAKPSPPNQWIEKLVTPFLTPFIYGVQDVINQKLKEFTIKAAIFGGGAALLLGVGVGTLVSRRRQLRG